jgi:hypothetical protein
VTPWYIATQPLTPGQGDAWDKYIAWSGLTHLQEVVSLDGILCPTLLPDIQPDYWPHIVNEDFMLNYFLDFEFLLGKVAAYRQKNLLCVFRNPARRPAPPPNADFEFPDFEFLGYDLVDVQNSVSALTNCGGFPDVFCNSELSTCGLLLDLDRALEVQRMLRSFHPDEPHADCHVWAIFRALGIRVPSGSATAR